MFAAIGISTPRFKNRLRNKRVPKSLNKMWKVPGCSCHLKSANLPLVILLFVCCCFYSPLLCEFMLNFTHFFCVSFCWNFFCFKLSPRQDGWSDCEAYPGPVWDIQYSKLHLDRSAEKLLLKVPRTSSLGLTNHVVVNHISHQGHQVSWKRHACTSTINK